MSFRVTFNNKDGSPGKATFPTEALANAYARSVKSAKVEPVDVAAPEVAVKVCPEGTAGAQRAASRDFYFAGRDGRKYVPAQVRQAEASEREAEAMMEHFNEARVVGMPLADAYADWDAR